MSFQLTEQDREELERLVFELENSSIDIRRQAAELLLLRRLYRAVRDLQLTPRVREILSRIPRISDKHAWDLLSAEEKREAGIDALELDGKP